MRVSSEELKKTCSQLRVRVSERFPTSGLNRTCGGLLQVSETIDKTIKWVNRPNYFIRVSSWILIAGLLLTIIRSWTLLKVSFFGMNIADFFQMIDAGFNSIVILGAAGIFLMTFETKRKRKRIINSVNHLRCIAHLIDAHQLTKDPHSMAEKKTDHSPERVMSEYDLGRYLDYCSEMLSIVGKLAFLYIQDFEDPIANKTVNDLENLTTGLQQKIWQKITLLKK